MRDIIASASILLAVLLVWPLAGHGQTLLIDPHVTMPLDYEFSLEIRAECAGSAVMGMETSIAFDPYLVRLDSISPGPWFTTSGEDFFFWDHTTPGCGEIHFTAAFLDAEISGDAVVAVCHFSVLGMGQSPLIFQDVDVRDRLNADQGFDHSVGDLIILDPAVPVLEMPLGGVKALFRNGHLSR